MAGCKVRQLLFCTFVYTCYTSHYNKRLLTYLLTYIKLVAKLMKCSANIAFYPFSSTCLITKKCMSTHIETITLCLLVSSADNRARPAINHCFDQLLYFRNIPSHLMCHLYSLDAGFFQYYPYVKQFRSRSGRQFDLGPNCLQRLSADHRSHTSWAKI